MNYELCKKLKDAGFPQRRGCSACLQGYAFDFKVVPYEEAFGDDYVSLPTLSELIEACGVDFPSLTRDYGDNSEIEWICNSPEYDCGSMGEITRGSTPEEAVANLWLKLNEK